LVAVLGQSIATLNQLIGERKGLVRAYRESNAPLNDKVAFLFGLQRNGWVDETFSSTLRGMGRFTDDCIFFGKLLCADLADHGNVIRSILKAQLRAEAPRVHRVEWDGVEPDLLPPETDYATWITGFPRRVPMTRGRPWGKRWYAVRRWARVLKRFLFRPRMMICVAIVIILVLIVLGGQEVLRAIAARLAF
jgi:hypothetical protein